MPTRCTPTLLLILDGWGLAPPGSGNATYLAKTPNLDALYASYPHSELAASGRAVGLPAGYIGNSEVGHLNIGAGRVVYQDMTRIDVALENGELNTNPTYLQLIAATKARGGRLHLAGLLSDGGVHSHIEHIKALARIATGQGVTVLVHCFMDGRDTSPHKGAEYLADLQEALAALPNAHIATVVGRYYAMDRDKHWERLSIAWNALLHGQAEEVTDAVAYMRACYDAGITDEFLKPARLSGRDTRLCAGDGLFLCNFRADRMRQLVQALVQTDFDSFERGPLPELAGIATMTPYDAAFPLPVAFPKDAVLSGLGEIVSQMGLRQLRLAETEKYAHVTYFFNGGVEKPFVGEDRILIPSPRDVDTYDLAPAMSCRAVTDAFVTAWKSGNYALIVCNLANGDMVGHTGVLDAAVVACEAVDECVGRMAEAVRESWGRMIIIADHGNCESMIAEDGGPQTAHTTNPVPCILADAGVTNTLENGRLADVAPTILALWNTPAPEVMTGHSLMRTKEQR